PLPATAPPEIYTLSLHDALPISRAADAAQLDPRLLRPARLAARVIAERAADALPQEHSRRGRASAPPHKRRPRSFEGSASAARSDRKSTRLNSSHDQISYAVFCL